VTQGERSTAPERGRSSADKKRIEGGASKGNDYWAEKRSQATCNHANKTVVEGKRRKKRDWVIVLENRSSKKRIRRGAGGERGKRREGRMTKGHLGQCKRLGKQNGKVREAITKGAVPSKKRKDWHRK